MEKLVEILTAFPTATDLSDTELSKQCTEWLKTHPKVHTASSLAGDISLLDSINPAVHSLGYLFVLAAHIDIHRNNGLEATWNYIASFLGQYDPRQTKHAPKEFRHVVESFCQYAFDTRRPILAIKPLKKALLRYGPSHFSFMHYQFTRLCLQGKCYRDAIPVLHIDVFDFPESRGGREIMLGGKGIEVVYQEVLQFYLYGAMLYMGVKKWRRAMTYLSLVLVAPGNACSVIQVEAYKKFILIGLLLDGKPPSMPGSISSVSSRTLKALAKPYEVFATGFMSGETDVFRREIESTAEVFRLEGNAGLAVQCMDAFRRKQIIALRDTYVTLGVDEIAQKNFDVTGRGGDVGSREETERVILGMIERDEISASLSQSGPDPSMLQTTVQFDTSHIDEADNLHALKEQIQRVVQLNTQVKQMDRKLGLSKEYIQYFNKQAKNSSGNTSGGGALSVDSDMMDFDYGGGAVWADEDMDETVMQDFEDAM